MILQAMFFGSKLKKAFRKVKEDITILTTNFNSWSTYLNDKVEKLEAQNKLLEKRVAFLERRIK